MADGNRSLSSSMSLPQWMKTKMNDRLNFDQSTFSPPETDDSFMYIRYNRAPTEAANGNLKQKINSDASSADQVTSNKTDFSKHTAPCQQFIPESNSGAVHTNQFMKPKSNGTDDGFKGDAAACGSSVIRVAHQMVTGKLTRGFTLSEEDFATPPKGFNPSLRRGSKSLPSSPLVSPNSSPKSKRRLPNKYFSGGTIDAEKIQGSWILSGLLRKHDYLSRSVSVINEEPPDTLTKTVSQMSIDEIPDKNIVKQKPKRKTAELREMNFWSPTSM